MLVKQPLHFLVDCYPYERQLIQVVELADLSLAINYLQPKISEFTPLLFDKGLCLYFSSANKESLNMVLSEFSNTRTFQCHLYHSIFAYRNTFTAFHFLECCSSSCKIIHV